MGKHRYKDVKSPDKFHEVLANAWTRIERYVLPVGLAVLAIVVLTAIWVTVAHRAASGRETPWARAFEVQRKARDAEAAAQTDADYRKAEDQALADLDALAREYPRRPVAALTLLELSQGHFRLGDRDRASEKTARAHFQKAAEAAEQALADFPDHALAPLAAYNAGKARLELREYERAAPHFERAQQTKDNRFLAALATLHAARCYEHLGRTDAARRAYEALRNDPWAGWCGQQAQWRLARLEAPAPKGS